MARLDGRPSLRTKLSPVFTQASPTDPRTLENLRCSIPTYFSSVFKQEENVDEMPDFCVTAKETLSNIDFTAIDVSKLLQNLNPSKSPGPS